MRTIDRAMAWGWLRLLAGVAILAVLAWQLGSEPFLDGLRRTDPAALLVALGVTALTTACCAARWRLLAERLGIGVPFRDAYRAVYRAQLLNATLPGGVVGDVHRGYRHGRDAGAVGRGLASVAWDRGSGQVVQALLTVAGLPLLLTSSRWALVLPAAVLVVGAGIAARGGVWPRVALLSAVASLGHVLVFVVAARTAGVTAASYELVALGLVVLLAAAVPLSVAGWGPREGAAAWVFGAAGLGASVGLQVAVVYGVMSLVATLPGILVLRDPRSARQAGSVGSVGSARGGVAWVSGPTSS